MTSSEFRGFLHTVGVPEDGGALAVAVSGGVDSTALALLLQRYAAEEGRGRHVLALLVDHGLRDGSSEEAEAAARRLDACGVRTRVLRMSWDAAGGRPAPGAAQVAAREARYALLGDECAARGVTRLFLAHQKEDQVETFFYRLGKASGIDGLSCMAPYRMHASRQLAKVALLRPLLPVSKARLAATVEELGQGVWAEDASNTDERHVRNRIRRGLLDVYRGDGGALGDDVMDVVAIMARAKERMRYLGDLFLARSIQGVQSLQCGYVTLDMREWSRLPEYAATRVLSRLVMCLGGTQYAARLETMLKVHRDVEREVLGRRRAISFGRCLISPGRGQTVVVSGCVYRSPVVVPRATADELPSFDWQGRFFIQPRGQTSASKAAVPVSRQRGGGGGGGGSGGRAPASHDWVVSSLTKDGWIAITSHTPSLVNRRRALNIPFDALLALPTIRDVNGDILAVPHLNFSLIPDVHFLVLFNPQNDTLPGLVEEYVHWIQDRAR